MSAIKDTYQPILFRAMNVYFIIPVAMVVILAYMNTLHHHVATEKRLGMFVVSILYTVSNIGHFTAELTTEGVVAGQVLLMICITALGVLINWECWKWLNDADVSTVGERAVLI